MAMQVVPEYYIWVCDGCGGKENSKLKNARPKYWTELRIIQDSYDFQGFAVADGSIHRLLCSICSSKTHKAINDCLKKADK